MNQEQRDIMQTEMHGDIKVLVSQGSEHHETLYGKDGVVSRLILIQERQDQCPARQATTMQGKRNAVAYVMMIIAIVGIIITLAVVLHT